MNEEFMKQIVAELIEAQGQALGTLTAALCQQIDPARFTADLQKWMASAEKLRGHTPMATRLLNSALAAAQAEKTLQARPLSEGPYPKRG